MVDGAPIAPADFGSLVTEVLAAADRVERRHGAPTEFEAVTCAALLWFARAGVDSCVVEVGLGGRLDASNAWDGGVAAITNVSLDHMEYLGDTVGAIAREKAAIIKRGDLAVTGTDGEALQIVRRRAARMHAPLRAVAPLEVVGMDRLGCVSGTPGSASFAWDSSDDTRRPTRRWRLGVMEALHERVSPMPAPRLCCSGSQDTIARRRRS